MQAEIPKVIQKLSSERFEAYRKPGESDERVLARVCWNTALSEALFPCLQGLEVGFRNSLHQAIAGIYGSGDWILRDSTVDPKEKEMHAAAIQELKNSREALDGWLSGRGVEIRLLDQFGRLPLSPIVAKNY